MFGAGRKILPGRMTRTAAVALGRPGASRRCQKSDRKSLPARGVEGRAGRCHARGPRVVGVPRETPSEGCGVAVPCNGCATSTATSTIATLSIDRASRVGVGSGVTEGMGAGAVSSDALAACPRLMPLSLDDAGTVTHAVTIKKTTRAALMAARRLRRQREARRPRFFRGVPVTSFAGDGFHLCATLALWAARRGSLASEESALVALRWARLDGPLWFTA